MEKVEAGDILNELIASRKIVETSRGPLWFEYPTISDRIFAKYVYNRKYKECIQAGIPTVEQSIEFHKKHGEWDELKESNLTKFPEYIDETTGKIKVEKNRIRKKKFEEWLNKLQSDYLQLLEHRNQMLCNSAEFLANDEATSYIVWQTFKNIDGSRLWPSYEIAMSSQEDARYMSELVSVYSNQSRDSTSKILREIARMAFWRVRWNACSDDMFSLFGRSAQDLSNDQFMLVYWSQLYDNVYESIDRPPDDVISDDEKLDEWLKRVGDERHREISQKYYSKHSSVKTNSKIENSSEVLRVVQGEWNSKGEFIPYTDEQRWKEIEKIRNLNSPTARVIKKREEERLKQTPGQFIQEHELRRKDEDRQTMGGKTSYIRKGNNK